MISFIVAVYNAAGTLAQCLDSVIAQTSPQFELLVIDGGSTDGSVKIIQERASKLAYWTSESDQGVYDAWNKALPHVQGDWVCFLGADDYLWSNDTVKRLTERLEDLPALATIAYGKIVLLDRNDEPMFALGEPWELIASQFNKKMCLPHPAVMHRRSLFETYGGFDTSFRIAGDYEFLLRSLKDHSPYFLGELVVTAMRPGGLSTNTASAAKGLNESYRALQKNGYQVSGFSKLMAWIRFYARRIATFFLGRKLAPYVLDWGRRWMGLPAYWTKV